MSDLYTKTDVRHDFVLLFDVADGNPNGDPDAGNLPRVDPETMQGLVTDVCLKRKVRDFVATLHEGEERFKIYVEHKGILYDQQALAYRALNLEEAKSKDAKKESTKHEQARAWMCANFYDVRTFGAVMSTTEFNCGQVRGPLQLTFARSVDPVVPMDLSITRVAVTRTGEDKETEMGRKALIPYGLYRGYGFYNPSLAKQTGFTSDDLALFWDSLQRMWDLDRSASRGMMACRGLYVFSHESPLGNAPAHKLFDLLRVTRKQDVSAPRSFSDYDVIVDRNTLASFPNVTLTEFEV